MDLHSHRTVGISTNGACPHSTILLTICCSAKHQNKKFPKFFFFFFINIISSVGLRVWGSGHGQMTRSITTNHPCLITSVELDRSWEGFSASERIPRSEWGGILDVEQSGRAPLDGMVWEYGPAPLFFLEPLPDSIMGREKPQFDKSWGGAGDPFGDHHCGNIVNCVFLRPWEPHTKV